MQRWSVLRLPGGNGPLLYCYLDCLERRSTYLYQPRTGRLSDSPIFRLLLAVSAWFPRVTSVSPRRLTLSNEALTTQAGAHQLGILVSEHISSVGGCRSAWSSTPSSMKRTGSGCPRRSRSARAGSTQTSPPRLCPTLQLEAPPGLSTAAPGLIRPIGCNRIDPTRMDGICHRPKTDPASTGRGPLSARGTPPAGWDSTRSTSSLRPRGCAGLPPRPHPTPAPSPSPPPAPPAH